MKRLARAVISLTLAAHLLLSLRSTPWALAALTRAPAGFQNGAATARKSPELKKGNEVRREITSNQVHSYPITLGPGEFLRLQLRQQGVDVGVRLLDPTDTTRLEVDSPNGGWGTEELAFVADIGGTHRIEVKTLETDLVVGRYRIRIEDLRVAREADRTLARSQQMYAEGHRLRTKETADSLRSAAAMYEDALRLQRAIDDRRGQAAALESLGEVSLLLGEGRTALDHFTQSLLLWRSIRDRGGEAVVLTNIGLALDDLGEKEKAIAHFNQALSLFQLLGDRREAANTLNNIGRAYVTAGEHSRALENFGRALSYLRTINSHRTAAILLNISAIHESMGDYRRAIDYSNQALSVFQLRGETRAAAYATLAVGSIQFRLGDYQSAIDFFGKALGLLRTVGDRVGEAKALNNLGRGYTALVDRARALECLNQAREIALAVGDRSREAYTLNGLGMLLQSFGDAEKSVDLFNQALELMRSLHNRLGEAQVLNNISKSYVSLGQTRKALESLLQALATDREVKDQADEGNTLSNLMVTWQTFGNRRLAIFYGKQSLNIFQGLRANVSTLGREVEATFLKSKEETYRTLTDLLITEGRLQEAQQVIRMLKEDEYREFIHRGGETSPQTSSLGLTSDEIAWDRRERPVAAHVLLLGRQRRELLSKRSLTHEDEQVVTRIEADLQIAQQVFQTFVDKLSHELGTSDLARQRTFQIQESQGLMEDLRELGDMCVALYTIVGAEKYTVILVTPDLQKAYTVPMKVDELARQIVAFRHLLQDPNRDPLPLAQKLYRVLVAPMAEDLKDAGALTLMWSLDGVLRYLPIAALHDGKQYLVERYRNVVFTPASHTRLKEIPNPRWTGLGVGVSKAVGGFDELPSAKQELYGIIRRRYARDSSRGILDGRILLDEAFTRERLRAALRQHFPMVHVASHFRFVPGNEADSFLLLGNGERISLSEIKTSLNIFEGVDLLTLSACDTATGGMGGADGSEIESFGVLAQRQGAKAVVASLWAVADNSTAVLMQRFHQIRAARHGITKAEALRQAQLSLLRGEEPDRLVFEKSRGVRIPAIESNPTAGKHFRHPFYWAPFILIGNWK